MPTDRMPVTAADAPLVTCGVVTVQLGPDALPRVPDAARHGRRHLPSTGELLDAARRAADAPAVLAGEVGEEGLLVAVEAALRHLARAHRACGMPLAVHTTPRLTTGLDVAEVLDHERVDPSAVLLTGCGTAPDTDHLAELAGWGFRLGIECAPGDEHAPDVAAELCRRGLADRVVLLAHHSHGTRARREPVERALRGRGVADGPIAAALGGTAHAWLLDRRSVRGRSVRQCTAPTAGAPHGLRR